MPIVGVITLYASLLMFALRVHPDHLDYVDQVLVSSKVDWLYLWINPHMDLFTICVNVNLNCVVFNLYREHVSRSFLANQSLKILEQLNWLLHFLVLLWKSTMMLSWLLHFLITLSLWITLKVEQINSWQWLLFKAWWKTTLASQLLRRCVSLFPLLTQFLLFLNISKHVCRLRCYSN